MYEQAGAFECCRNIIFQIIKAYVQNNCQIHF